MATINSSVQLARIRSKIDAQQQIVSDLELLLQQNLLGGLPTTSIQNVIDTKIAPAYAGITDGASLQAALVAGLNDFKRDANNDSIATLAEAILDPDSIRQMLYQARAMLGELRIEEQHWNSEVTEEKTRRKELLEFAKG